MTFKIIGVYTIFFAQHTYFNPLVVSSVVCSARLLGTGGLGKISFMLQIARMSLSSWAFTNPPQNVCLISKINCSI